MSTDRRAFLKQAGLGATSLAVLPTAGHASTVAAADTVPTAASSLAGWEQQQQDPWDTSWAARITGKHKAMFDIPEIEGGVGVLRSGIWQRQYMDTLKVPQSDLSAVMVIRHNAIFLAMNQEFWTTYEVGKAEKIKNDAGKIQQTNPVLPSANGPQPPASMASLLLDKQIANGASALGCGLAYRSVVSLIQKKDKLTPAEARTKANGMLVPGVIMQPSGIFANVMAQQAGCVFVQAV
ncbi:MAG: hypothetical protein ACK54K_07740 [Gemmatimonadaceae bacterium]